MCHSAWCVLSFWSLFLASHIFSTSHVWLFEIVSTYCATVCYSAMSLVYLHTLTSKMSCRLCRLCLERVVTWSDCEFDIIRSKHGQRHGRFDEWYSLYWPNVYTQIALHITPYHITSCCIISFYTYIYILVRWYQ